MRAPVFFLIMPRLTALSITFWRLLVSAAISGLFASTALRPWRTRRSTVASTRALTDACFLLLRNSFTADALMGIYDNFEFLPPAGGFNF